MKKLFILILIVLLGLLSLTFLVFSATKRFQVDTGGTLTTSLVSYYKLEDATDFFGSNNLTNNGTVTFSSGKVNNAAFFNGSNYLSFDSPIITATNTFSLDFWVYLPSTSTFGALVENGKYNAPNEGGFTLYIASGNSLNPGNNLALLIWGTGSFQFSGNIGTGWHHVAVTMDGSNVWKSYIDGTYQSSYSRTQTILAPLDHFYLGNSNHSGFFISNGVGLDELGLWNKVLSSTEISDLYNGGAGQTMIVETINRSVIIIIASKILNVFNGVKMFLVKNAMVAYL